MPTVPPDHVSDYYTAVHEAEEDAREALAAIAAEHDEGRISTRQAADERVQLLENHLERLRQLRLEHLGDSP